MTILIVGQHSRLSQLVTPHEGDVITPAHYVAADGSRHPTSGWKPGMPPGSARRWVPPVRVRTWPATFAELCEQFPAAVATDTGRRPPWGSAYYAADADGFPALVAENWDTSD